MSDATLRVSFELKEEDIRYFRERFNLVRKGRRGTLEEARVIQGAKALAQEASAAELPAFVRERMENLQCMIDMLRDDDWSLQGTERKHIVEALAYFVDPEDLIPDRIPVIGYLDDAIMIELVVRELRHEIEAYTDFCAYREAKGDAGEVSLEARRKALQSRMRRRRKRERSGTKTRAKAWRTTMRLW